MTTKTCGKCGTAKAPEMFHRDRARTDGLQSRCKACSTIRRTDYAISARAKSYMRFYGLSPEQFEDIGCLQGWTCAICSAPFESFPEAPSVDHCHSTGQVRGLLCRKCNTMLGNAQDSVEILTGAIAYLHKLRDTP
jgi:RNase P subunit RPR2